MPRTETGSKACQVRWEDVVRHVCQGHHGGTKKPGERQHHRCACGSVLTCANAEPSLMLEAMIAFEQASNHRENWYGKPCTCTARAEPHPRGEAPCLTIVNDEQVYTAAEGLQLNPGMDMQ